MRNYYGNDARLDAYDIAYQIGDIDACRAEWTKLDEESKQHIVAIDIKRPICRFFNYFIHSIPIPIEYVQSIWPWANEKEQIELCNCIYRILNHVYCAWHDRVR